MTTRGGKRNGAGRKKGATNKATAELKEIARQHTPEMLAELVRIATTGESEQARVAAIEEVLDRGYGKPAQSVMGDNDGPPIQTILEVTCATIAKEAGQ